MTTLDPAKIAAETVNQVIAEGLATHPFGRWRNEDIRMHVLKAQRHLATFLLILDGHSPPDGELHLRNALTRTTMALTNYLHGPRA
ncbi:MAG TPA: hypothetical protein VFE62_24185 [Gemmataceae bacterium]|nr:hypothetical protein [Gemmataceae bacterium]